MVTQLYLSLPTTEDQETQNPDFKWTTINLQEVFETNYRLEAGVYGTEGRQARQNIAHSKWDIVYLCGENGLATAYHRPRFKRIYVEKSSFPIYQPAQINELYPKPSAYISGLTQTDIDALRVKKGQVLLTCSGTIGNCTYVRDTLDNLIFSHDVIRIEPKEYSGFIYAFLKSKIGFSIINTNNYGAVVKHIEPEHLNHVPIPNPPVALKQEIHDLIEESFKLRDESNELMDAAQSLLKTELKLPTIEVLIEQAEKFNRTVEVLNYSVSSSEVIDRLDGTYYDSVVKAIETHIAKRAKEIVKVVDGRISKSVTLPGRFKRVYVEEGNGIVFFTGKHISDLDPSDKKYLSLSQHTEKIENELIIREGMILVTSSGTLANTVLVPKHWDGWAMTHDIIRVVPVNKEISGYLYAWLSSDYARELIHRFAYGAVVRHLEKEHISQVSVPLLSDENAQQEINDTVLEANRKRTEAYNLEQQALRVLDEKVIYAR
ncbi:MAG: restriction endonuclease subunit S [Candidatus Poribacteria bacterium]|nr:restriction endonuclease subunit S [Candidatus Poribacteria bacterium]